jgi:hypothetical protein
VVRSTVEMLKDMRLVQLYGAFVLPQECVIELYISEPIHNGAVSEVIKLEEEICQNGMIKKPTPR